MFDTPSILDFPTIGAWEVEMRKRFPILDQIHRVTEMMFTDVPVSSDDVWDLFWDMKKVAHTNMMEVRSPVGAPGPSLMDALLGLKLATSKREAREFIKNGSIRINGVKHVGPDRTFEFGGFVIRRGARNAGILFHGEQL